MACRIKLIKRLHWPQAPAWAPGVRTQGDERIAICSTFVQGRRTFGRV
jgi:hypothetical protein